MNNEQKPCTMEDLRASVEAIVSCHVNKLGFALNWVGDEPDLVRTEAYYCTNCRETFSDNWLAALDHLTVGRS